MPIAFGQANIEFGASRFTFGEFSVAYELSLIQDAGGRYSRKELFDDLEDGNRIKSLAGNLYKTKIQISEKIN